MIEANITAALRMMKSDNEPVAAAPEDCQARLHNAPPGGPRNQSGEVRTTLELVAAVESGMEDVVVAFPLMGPNAARVREIAAAHPAWRISTLVESVDQIDVWRGSTVGAFVDPSPGMDRTGMAEDNFEEVRGLIDQVQKAGLRFCGLHHYDGQINNTDPSAAAKAREGYSRLVELIAYLKRRGIEVTCAELCPVWRGGVCTSRVARDDRL